MSKLFCDEYILFLVNNFLYCSYFFLSIYNLEQKVGSSFCSNLVLIIFLYFETIFYYL